MRLVRPLLLLAMLALVAPLTPRTASAEGGTSDGSLYLLVSVGDTFDTDVGEHTGSTTVLVNLGTVTGGGGILDPRFIAGAISPLSLPTGVSLADLGGNASTLVGSYQLANQQDHLLTPVTGSIDGDVQIGVFEATHDGTLDGLNNQLDGEGQKIFPTTYSIASAIAGHMPGRGGEPSDADVTNVASSLFGAPHPLVLAAQIVTSEGELFPHDDSYPSIFHFALNLKAAANDEVQVDTDVCRLVSIDIHPGSSKNPVNVGKKGVLPVAFLTTSTFDATEIDGPTLRIGTVSATNYAVEDVDGDGDKDLVCKFDVPALVSEGLLSKSTTSLTVRADLTDGTCVQGTDIVTPK